jgi:hypothetical protein
MGDLLPILGLAILSMANPTLLAAVTVMLLLPSPRRLMLGYLLGAYVTSIASGVIILYALEGSSTAETARTTISPAEDAQRRPMVRKGSGVRVPFRAWRSSWKSAPYRGDFVLQGDPG